MSENLERKRKIKTSQQEKYDFLMSLIGKSEEEKKNSIMSSRSIV